MKASPDMSEDRDALTGAGLDQAPPIDGFEHRRAIASARLRLFGSGPVLRIGRYRIEGRIGAGGMGEVYLGHDDTLDRKVAVKRVLAGFTSEREQARLRDEARALAKLSHANVVQVYEIGEHEQRTFLAMEFVEGQTLAAWLAEAPRDWRAVLERFVAAGQGLAAAHRAGVIHRDFKPDNVLLGREGSVRVADFGLALAGSGRVARASGQPVELARDSATGSVAGTIRYMALEQLLGETVDARSDQFSFCVALYEALWGGSPFALGTVLQRIEALETTPPRPPGRSRVPAGLWRILRRGLARAPAERWPDMPSLLAALERLPRARARAIAAAIGLPLLGLGGLVVLVVANATSTPTPDPCAEIERELAGVWDAPRRDALAGAFAAPELADAGASAELVAAGLDRWATGWLVERERVCRASDQQRIAPPLAAAESACLARQQRKVARLVETLSETLDADAIAGAIEAVDALASAASCGDPIDAGLPPPEPGQAAKVDALRDELGQAWDLRMLGRVERGRERVEALHAQAEAIGYGPLLAEVAAERAYAELAAGSMASGRALLNEAIDLAERHRHERLLAELWTSAALLGFSTADDEAAAAWALRRAEVAWQKFEPDLRSSARLSFARARQAEFEGRAQAGQAELRAAIATIEGREVSEIAALRSALADSISADAPEAALAERTQALADAEHFWGPNHPQTANYAYKLGAALLDQDAPRAAALLERAVAIWTQVHHRPHPDLGTARMTLARLALRAGELDEAEAHARALARIYADTLAPEHPDQGDPELLLAIIEGVRGDRASALEHAERAVALWEPVLAPDSAKLVSMRSEVAANLLALGRLDEAEHAYAVVLEHAPDSIATRVGLVELQLRRDRLEAADASLRAAEALADPGPHAFSLALLRALVDLRRGRLEPSTIAALTKAGETSPFTAAQVDAWLDELAVTESERRRLQLGRAAERATLPPE